MTTHLDYTATLYDNGAPVIHDLDCELVISTEFSPADFDISVTAVIVGEVDLLRSHDPAWKRIGMMIAEQAETSEWVVEKMMAEEGVVYRGLGGLDPDGRYVRTAA
jgi:hypothetical protein